MPRQARSAVTRRRIIEAAVDVFSEVGYPAAGLADVLERVEMTKGALYHHFDSKESVASAIIDEGAVAALDAFRSTCAASSPALENMIHGTFVAASLTASDKVVRTGGQLVRTLGEFNGASNRVYGGWLMAMKKQARQAQIEGDLRESLDPDAVGEAIVAALAGTQLISATTSGSADLIPRFTRSWEILLFAITADRSLPYFREFLAREALRHEHPPLTIG
jgi:AcrR family transcriptional regulator